ncbi:hypothetical protein CHUAL_010024, partial [Chamberlinius hualienensis]
MTTYKKVCKIKNNHRIRSRHIHKDDRACSHLPKVNLYRQQLMDFIRKCSTVNWTPNQTKCRSSQNVLKKKVLRSFNHNAHLFFPIHSSFVTTKSDVVGISVGEIENARLTNTDNNRIDVLEMEYARPNTDVGSNQIFPEPSLHSTNEMSTSIRNEDIAEVEISGDKNEGCCSNSSKHGIIDVAPYQILTCPERCVSNAARHVKRLSHLWFSHLLLLSILLGYTTLGAIIFNTVERPHENQEKHDLIEMRRTILTEMWNLSQNATNDIDWLNKSKDILIEFEGHLNKLYKMGFSTNPDTVLWSFWGAMFYCGTVYSTIGYGHIVPSTEIGRALTMVYATFGIPLLLMVLADFGKLFTRGIKFIWSLAHRFYYTKSCKELRRTVPIQVSCN